MNVDEIRQFCLAFPQTTEKLQWGDDLCFKIRGKIFAIVSLDHRKLCFKCAPDTFAELIEREEIRPAPYVGRYNWVLVEQLDALHNNEVKDLIRHSYEMAEAKAPKAKARTPKGKKKADRRRGSGHDDRATRC